MIVRVQFKELGTGKIIHTWCLFSVIDTESLRDIFDSIFEAESEKAKKKK